MSSSLPLSQVTLDQLVGGGSRVSGDIMRSIQRNHVCIEYEGKAEKDLID